MRWEELVSRVEEGDMVVVREEHNMADSKNYPGTILSQVCQFLQRKIHHKCPKSLTSVVYQTVPKIRTKVRAMPTHATRPKLESRNMSPSTRVPCQTVT